MSKPTDSLPTHPVTKSLTPPMLHRNSLRLFALLSAMGYLALRLWMPLVSYALPARRPDVAAFAPWPWGTLAYALLLGLLFGVYFLAYRTVLRSPRPPGLPALLLPGLLFAVLLLGAFPINALDSYNYLILGREQAVFGQNPYLTPPNALAAEPFLRYVGEWGKDTSNYGPVFQQAAATIAAVSGDDLVLGLILFKGLAVLCWLLAAVLIWLLLRGANGHTRAARTLLWAWNPALLLSFAMNGHNDSMMLLWLLLGLWLLRRGHSTLGLVVMALAPLTKMSGLLPIPFFLLAALRDLPTARERLRLAGGVLLGSMALTWLWFLPYGPPWMILPRLLDTAQGVGYSPLAVPILALGRLQAPVTRSQWALAGALALAALLLVWLRQSWRGRSPLRGAADSLAAYVALALSFRIWYAAWPFPWLLLDAPPSGAARHTREQAVILQRLHAGLWFLVCTQYSVLIYGQMRTALLGGERVWAHLLAVPVVFLLPLALAPLRLEPRSEIS